MSTELIIAGFNDISYKLHCFLSGCADDEGHYEVKWLIMIYFCPFCAWLALPLKGPAVILRIWSWLDRSGHGWSLSVVPGVQLAVPVKLRYHFQHWQLVLCLWTFKHVQPTRIWLWLDEKPAALLPPRWWISLRFHSCRTQIKRDGGLLTFCKLQSISLQLPQSDLISYCWRKKRSLNRRHGEGPNTRYYKQC